MECFLIHFAATFASLHPTDHVLYDDGWNGISTPVLHEGATGRSMLRLVRLFLWVRFGRACVGGHGTVASAVGSSVVFVLFGSVWSALESGVESQWTDPPRPVAMPSHPR